MKKQFKHCRSALSIVLAVLVLAVAAVFPASAKSGTAGKCKWSFNEETGALKITGSGAIPDYFYNNSEAGWDDFANKIKSVSIGNSVTSIGHGSFDDCKNLESVKIGTGVKKIGCYAFYNCTKLAKLTIPANVAAIDDGAFRKCSKLETLSLKSGVKSLGTMAFSECKSLKKVLIPNSVTTLWAQVFRKCTALTSVSFGKKVKEISASEFDGCTSLKSVKIPYTVKTIDSEAYSNCSALKKVFIPNTVTKVGSHAFGYKVTYSSKEQSYSKVKDFTIYAVKGTAGAKYAKSNKFTVKYVALSAYSVSLKVKKTKTLTASGGKVSSWVSSDTKIAKVNKNGKITAVKKGTAYITAKMTNGAAPVCKVVVK